MTTEEFRVDLFAGGGNFECHRYLGAHRAGDKYVFRVWAPGADAVYLAGSFNGFSDGCLMEKNNLTGVWEAFAAASPGDRYRYRIVRGGILTEKSDPYGYFTERPEGVSSVVFDLQGFEWGDGEWLRYRRESMSGGQFYSRPINIYEVHAPSWKRHTDGKSFTWRELAADLAPYVKQMGYTHIELMPVTEYPHPASWGYQVCGYFAPTCRLGTPHELMGFIDYMHRAGIGVILDWVPAHFPKDPHGLFEFDGGPLYEYSSAERRENRGWGTRMFDLGRGEAVSFLLSNAAYWAEEYHADGLRVDAVASMLYLDYDKKKGEWTPNEFGDNRCLEAVAFFRRLNGYMREKNPGVLMVAEESSEWKNITKEEGLGFSLKWNMGWMNDTLSYLPLNPHLKKKKHHKMTFSLSYAFGERYILPLSHDEVVHEKNTIIGRMHGGYGDKFAAARAYALYMMTHPGKKISFMGNEIGQFAEWSHDRQIDWFLLDYESHARHQLYHAELNNFYLEHPALWDNEEGWEGFHWIDPDNSRDSVFSYRRISRSGDELITVINFAPRAYRGFVIGVPGEGNYREIFNSDDKRFGGNGMLNEGILIPRGNGAEGLPRSVALDLPALSGIILAEGNNNDI